MPQGPIFDPLSKLFVLIGYLQKGLFTVCIFYVLRKTSRFMPEPTGTTTRPACAR
jgi:hypothetical protein